MAQHTAGKWEVNTATKEIFGQGGTVANYWNKKRISSENESNARLIASAPDLLEACKKAVETLKCLSKNTHTIEIIEKAIAKAE